MRGLRKGRNRRNRYVQQQGPSHKKTQDLPVLTNVRVRFVLTSEENAKFDALYAELNLDGSKAGGCI